MAKPKDEQIQVSEQREYPWKSICMPWSRQCKKLGLTEVLLRSSHKLHFTKFLALTIFSRRSHPCPFSKFRAMNHSYQVNIGRFAAQVPDFFITHSADNVTEVKTPYFHKGFTTNTLFLVSRILDSLSILF